MVAWVLLAAPAMAQPRVSAGEAPAVGVEERLGALVPLDVTLRGEDGEQVVLRDLFDRPVLLLFVYYRCPSICGPLLRELARALDQMEGMEPGRDFRVVTVSFDPDETPEVAATTKAEVLRTMKRRPSPDGWRFLTGDEATIRGLTEATGFRYGYDEGTQTFLHATSLIFLTRDGKIVRYIGGIEFLPAQLKMAVIDAMTGRERSFMKTVERVCYAYDPKANRYVLVLDRIIFGVTGLLVLAFVAYLVWKGRERKAGAGQGAAHAAGGSP